MGTEDFDLRSRLPRRRHANTVALRLLAAVAVGAVLYFGRDAFIPLALAILISLLLTTPVEALHRHGVPRAAAAIVLLLLLGGLLGGAGNLLWTPAHSWWASAPKTLRTIEHKVRPLQQMVERAELLSRRAGLLSAPSGSQPRSGPAAVAATDPQAPRAAVALTVLHLTGAALIGIVTVIIVTLFILAGGPPMFARMSTALAADLQSTRMLTVIDAVRREVGRYYGSIALINLGLGLATTAVTLLLGMPNPLLWGAVAAALNFLPYIGSATTLLLLTLVAFVSFSTIGRVAAVAGSYLALATIEGQLVEPLVLGRRLELNPIIVFLALWFGGWFWGISGIILAVPAVVVLKVGAEHAKHGRPLQEFLGLAPSWKLEPARVRESLKRRARNVTPAAADSEGPHLVQVVPDDRSLEQARKEAEAERREAEHAGQRSD